MSTGVGFKAIQTAIPAIAGAMIGIMHRPAAIVADGEFVVSSNAAWDAIVAHHHRDLDIAPTLRRCLSGFIGVDTLIDLLGAGEASSGVLTITNPGATGLSDDPRGGAFAVRWRQVALDDDGANRSLAVVVLEDQDEAQHLVSALNSQRVRIRQLLIRQTLIEEKTKRRIGRALHDGLGQDLAHLRAMVCGGVAPDQIVVEIDRAIQSVRDMTFDLSPPILEDLGLLPALHWLAEYAGKRYGTRIVVADDGAEPALSGTTRTIVFRAVRELVVNAAKHAPGAEVVLTSLCGQRAYRVGVRDSGAGFDLDAVTRGPEAVQRYGLISVEQQIRGIGGAFDLVSAEGEGTRATITLPLGGGGEDGHA